MHILLTDILRCPRCGPEFGLILLADELTGRRVASGRLGCANCREAYPIRGGEVDLRLPGADPMGGSRSGPGADDALRVGALLGVRDLQGSVLVAGGDATLVGELARLAPELHVVSVQGGRSQTAGSGSAPPVPGLPEGRGGTSTVLAGASLPFAASAFRGVALLGGPAEETVASGMRALAPGGRLVTEGARGAARARVEQGARLLLEEAEWAVAERSGEGPR